MERKRRRGCRLRGDINSCPSFPQWTAWKTSGKVFEGRCKFSEKYTNENSIIKESSTFCYRYVFTLLKNKQEFQDWLKKPKRQGRFVFFLQTFSIRAVSLFCWLHTKTALSWRLLLLPSLQVSPSAASKESSHLTSSVLCYQLDFKNQEGGLCLPLQIPDTGEHLIYDGLGYQIHLCYVHSARLCFMQNYIYNKLSARESTAVSYSPQMQENLQLPSKYTCIEISSFDPSAGIDRGILVL